MQPTSRQWAILLASALAAALVYWYFLA